MESTKIVILNWNGREHLELFLPKILAVTPCDVELVVADNASDDSSVEFLKTHFPEIRILQFDDNYGYAGGYNRALSMLEADYFILMNSDVVPGDGWLSPLLEIMSSDERIIAAAPKLLSYDNRDHFEYAGASGGFMDMLGYPFCRGRILATLERDDGQYDDTRGVFWASGACMIVRGDKFKEIGGFDEDFFVHMEEIDFCWRAQLYGYKVMVVPCSKVYHLGGGTLPNNSPRKLYYNFRNNLAMLYKNLPARSLRWIMPLRMFLDLCSAVIYIFIGKKHFADAVLKAHKDYRSWRDILYVRRQQIWGRTIVGSVDTMYRGSILLRYFLGKRTFDRLM